MIKYVIIGIVFFLNLNFIPLYALLPLLFLIFWFYPSKNNLRTVWILVLGDIGHSPRIFNQALSLIQNEKKVILFGFNESKLPSESTLLIENGSLELAFLPIYNSKIKSRLLNYFLKTIYQFIFILFTFTKYGLKRGNPGHILIQNPPSIPSIIVSLLYSNLVDAKFIIDWHNYGFSIMRIQKQNKYLVLVGEIYEKLLARFSDVNFTVTEAMKKDLLKNFGATNVHILYDQPHPRFKSLSNNEKEVFFDKVSKSYPLLEKVKSGAKLIVSSTSWTKDEDFSILLDALVQIDSQLKSEIVLAITGKGPEKEYYLKKISEIKFKNVSIFTPWLEADDYPKLLGCADLGVCLHTSSSGLDFPMKVIDMFGSGLPVLALNFVAISELIHDNKNGRIFNNSEELASLILETVETNPSLLQEYRKYVNDNRTSWTDHWNQVAKQHFF